VTAQHQVPPGDVKRVRDPFASLEKGWPLGRGMAPLLPAAHVSVLGPNPLADDNGGTLPLDNGVARPADEGRHYAKHVADAKGTLVLCLTADEFFAAESPAKLVVPALGICPGPPTGIVGQTYVGKTITGLSLGLSVALGRPLWGTWSVQQGPWLHMDYEQGRRHTKKRIHRLARAFGISDEQLRGRITDGTIRIAVFPDLRLTTVNATDHFRRAFEGVRIVTCDSLRMMLGAVDENSSQVRSLMGSITTASDASEAAVSLIHHAGKTPNEGSQRTRKEQARGSSAIVDEFQSMFVLTKKKGDEVTLVTHEKDRELGEAVADFGLRIEDVPAEEDMKWGLRVVHVDREQMKPKGENSGAKFLKAMATARTCIRDNPGIAGAEAVAERVGVRAQTIRAAVKQIVADGEVVSRKAPRGGVRLYLKHVAPTENA
jgi:hypothetical protein